MAELMPDRYAVNQRWTLRAPYGNWEALIAEYLDTLAHRCHETGTCIIGHIKALALFPDGGYLRVSVVLTLNVIVYGLGRDLLEQITNEAASHFMHKWGGKIIIEPI
jgi:hypothetical protein